jgi:hypothetical protein
MLSLSGIGSSISAQYFPSIDVSRGEWEIGLVDLMTYHSIPNVEKGRNNRFYFGVNNSFEIDEGAYEIENLETAIKSKLGEGVEFKLTANNSTLKSALFCSEIVDFTPKDSIASLLGFDNKKLAAGITHVSDRTVDIVKVNSIRVECNIVRGSYDNGKEGHVIHNFYPNVAPGYKIVEVPNTIIYLPLNVNRITDVTITLRDQDKNLINLRGEALSVRLHIREKNHGACI